MNDLLPKSGRVDPKSDSKTKEPGFVGTVSHIPPLAMLLIIIAIAVVVTTVVTTGTETDDRKTATTVFDSEKWKIDEHFYRHSVVHSLTDSKKLVGMNTQQVRAMLGNPKFQP